MASPQATEALAADVQATPREVSAQLAARRAQRADWPTVLERFAQSAPGVGDDLCAVGGRSSDALREDLKVLQRILALEQQLSVTAATH